MKRFAAILTAIAFLVPAGAAAQQNTYQIASGKTITLTVPGATSAYPINPTIVQAGIIDGAVSIHAIGAGATTVVVITSASTITLSVVVTATKLADALGGAAPSSIGDESESGSYQGTYNSGAGQVTNAFDFEQRQGNTYRRATIVTASYVTPTSGASRGTGFPLISYEVRSPGHDTVYLDEAVTTSPLTFQNSIVRGIHVTSGLLTLHAGVSSVATFGSFFIPTAPQWVFGATRGLVLSRSSSVAANLYDVIDSSSVESNAEGGLIGSLLYDYHPQPHFSASAELGLSRSIGFAAEMNYDDPTQHADASVMDKPATFATLATQAQQGLFGTFDYERSFGDRLSVNASGQKSDYNLPSFRENTLTAQGNANYRLGSHWSLGGGALYSSFASIYPTVFNLRTLALPLTLDYGAGHVSAGVSYTPTTDFNGTLASGYGGNVGLSYGRMQIGGFYTHNVDIPTLASIFSEVPGLQAALEQAGINVTDPAQLAAVLSNAALLASLGFSGLKLNVAPARNDEGFNALWALPGLLGQQLSLNYLDSAAQLAQGQFDFKLATLTYMRNLNNGNQMNVSVSSLRSVESSQVNAATPVVRAGSSQVTYGVSFEHRFGAVPAFLFPVKRGSIQGYVYRDDDARGSYAKDDAGLAGVAVSLDGERTVLTDASGHYVFSGVPYGAHEVAANLKSSKPFYFTTDSPAEASIGDRVNFGVSFVQGKIFGYVTNDAGQGIGGVTVRLAGSQKSAVSEDDGRFVIEGVPQGRHLVAAVPDSFPDGYDLTTLKPAAVDVSATTPWPVTLTVRALRSVSGTVTLFDPRHGRLKPAQGMEVTIPQLGLKAATDGNGVYTFRNLPAGTFTVQVAGGNATQRRQVTLPPEPTTRTAVDFRVTVRQVQMQHERESREHSSR